MASASKRVSSSLDRTSNSKRQHKQHQTMAEETKTHDDSILANDPFIGLDVCGKVYYCRQSTLTNASPYFNRRFNGDFNGSISFIDSQGRTVYFVERPPTTFQYIFEYIVSGSTLNLPDFQTDPSLIRNLRTEADYFGLEHLCDSLKVTKIMEPNRWSRGLLYWLGTNKGSTEYQNPFTIGSIDIRGWMDDIANKDLRFFNEAQPSQCRARFVEYREPLKVRCCSYDATSLVIDHSEHNIFGYCTGNEYFPDSEVILELKTLSLRPTHLSMRASLCCMSSHGMYGCLWYLEGSEDGINWDRLYCPKPSWPSPGWRDARDKHKLNLVYHPLGVDHSQHESIVDWKLAELAERHLKVDEMSELMLDFMETECRETWKLDPPPTKFYRYFRIESDDEGCFHVQGFELFGDVHEP